eukprot:1676475-Rhodomonas_salina.1
MPARRMPARSMPARRMPARSIAPQAPEPPRIAPPASQPSEAVASRIGRFAEARIGRSAEACIPLAEPSFRQRPRSHGCRGIRNKTLREGGVAPGLPPAGKSTAHNVHVRYKLESEFRAQK